MLSESLDRLARASIGLFDLMDVLKALLVVPMLPISMSLWLLLENWSYVRRALLGKPAPERWPMEAPLLPREPRLKILRKSGRSVDRQPTHMPTAISPYPQMTMFEMPSRGAIDVSKKHDRVVGIRERTLTEVIGRVGKTDGVVESDTGS